MMKTKLKITVKEGVLLIAGAIILAFGLYNVHSISGVTEGGVLGLTLLFDNWFGLSPAISGLILNILCYLVGFRTLGKKFIVFSAISGLTFSASYAVFELFPHVYPGIAEYPIVCSIVGALFVGVGVGLCVRAGGAPSGDDALSMSFSKLLKIKIQYVYLFTDLIVLLLSLTYIPLTKIMYSLLTVILSGQIIGLVSSKKTKELPESPETKACPEIQKSTDTAEISTAEEKPLTEEKPKDDPEQ